MGRSLAEGVTEALLATQSSPLTTLFEGNDRNLQEVVPPSLFCPFPLIPAASNATNAIDQTGCAFRCTGTMTNDGDIAFYSSLTQVVGGVSLVLSLFIFLTWGMFWQKAKQKMTFWVAFSSVAVTSCVFFPAIIIGNTEDVWCKDEVESVRQSDGFSACVVQGMAIVFFGLSLCAWWFCSCFDIFSKLYRRKRNIQHYLTYYHIFSWGLSSLSTLVILGTGHFGFEQPRLWCFLEPDTPSFFEFVFFYAWVGVLWVSGSVMMGLVIWSIFAQARTFNRRGANGNNRQQARRANYFKKLSLYRIPIIFVLTFSVFWAVFFTFVIITEVQRSDLEDNAVLWFTCLLGSLQFVDPNTGNFLFPNPAETTSPDFLAAIGFPAVNGGCGDVQPNGLSPTLLTIAVLTLTGNGILIFLVFGLQYENFKLWSDWIGGCCSSSDTATGNQPPTKKKKPLSTFAEKRVGFAMFFVRMCQRLAGQEVTKAPGSPAMDSRRAPKVKFDKPLLDNEGNDYTPRYVTQHSGSGSNTTPYGVPAAGPGAMMTTPRVSYNKSQMPYGVATREDPFPMPNNRYFVDSVAVNQASGPQMGGRQYGAPPGRNQEFGDGYDEDNLSSAWSDVYNDPLWGINVEF